MSSSNRKKIHPKHSLIQSLAYIHLLLSTVLKHAGNKARHVTKNDHRLYAVLGSKIYKHRTFHTNKKMKWCPLLWDMPDFHKLFKHWCVATEMFITKWKTKWCMLSTLKRKRKKKTFWKLSKCNCKLYIKAMSPHQKLFCFSLFLSGFMVIKILLFDM